jgi:hypothetical protein
MKLTRKDIYDYICAEGYENSKITSPAVALLTPQSHSVDFLLHPRLAMSPCVPQDIA